MSPQKISSLHNPVVKSLIRLGKKKERDLSGLMLIEGVRELHSALKNGIEVTEIFICPTLATDEEKENLLTVLGPMNIKQTEVTPQVLEKITYRGSSSFLAALAKKMKNTLDDLRPGASPLYLVVDSVEKPGNIGAIFRSADGAGASGVLISDPVTDLSNPNLIRASLGTVFSIPSAISQAEEIIKWLKKHNIRIMATTPRAEKLYSEMDLTGPVAIAVGSEDSGISGKWMDACDDGIKLPMHGNADSLNVSVAAAIVLYEALRQRKQVTSK
ncbi:MAG: RNA methyltransferase [Candidatus Krumholzibacteriota bacterium]|nr:RNA methyltransferase [Candidatus Krumholzibacteriota bacterium]